MYGLNEDMFFFYEEFFEIVSEIGNKDIIVVGDFNFIMDFDLDYYNYFYFNNFKVRDKVIEKIN